MENVCSTAPSWRTERHEQGYCALYGTAGHRADGDALDRPNNTRAQASLPCALCIIASLMSIFDSRCASAHDDPMSAKK